MTNSPSEKKKPKPKQKTQLIHFLLSFPNHQEIQINHMMLSGFILPYSLQVKNHRGRGADAGILQNSLLQSTNQRAAQTCNQMHLLKGFSKGQTCLSTYIPSLSDLKVSKRASVVYCNFFWFGLAIGHSPFSPLLHFQNVLSAHLTGWTRAACVNLWKDMLAHCCTAQSQPPEGSLPSLD